MFLGGTAAFLGEVLELYCPEEHEEDMGNEKNGESLGENQAPRIPMPGRNPCCLAVHCRT